MSERNLPKGVVYKVETNRIKEGEDEFLVVTFYKYKSISIDSKFKDVSEETEERIIEKMKRLINRNPETCYIFDFLYMIREVEKMVCEGRENR